MGLGQTLVRHKMHVKPVLGAALGCLMIPCVVAAGPFAFTNVTASVGITHTHYHPANIHPYGYSGPVSFMSGGAVAEDFDGDGWLDLYVPSGFYTAPKSVATEVDL